MTRAYGLLLCLYPRSYRQEFAAEMIKVFEQSAVERRKLGCVAFARFLMIEAGGLLKELGIQWFSALSRPSEHSGDFAPAADASLPAEIVEAQQRIRYNLRGMEYAIAHHQFERARFFSVADQKERDKLRALWLSYGLSGEPRTDA